MLARAFALRMTPRRRIRHGQSQDIVNALRPLSLDQGWRKSGDGLEWQLAPPALGDLGSNRSRQNG